VPSNGDLMIHNDYRVVVERVRRRRIERVYFERVVTARVPEGE
jgi:hypothetical protein